MSITSAAIGSLYIPNFNGIAWSQPGGPGTTVYPQQANGNYVIPANPIPPAGPVFINDTDAVLWRAGCGHGYDAAMIFRDYDESTGKSAACVCCPICSFLVQVIEPYEAISDVAEYPIIIS